MEQDLLTLIHRNSRTSITIRSWSSPWKTLEMTDIPGAAYKATCRVASTANITTLSGLLTIDGIVLVANDRVLVKDQTASQNNGIYIASAELG
jgi:phage-related tail fiber protein